jgi:hypothetical protein
MSLSAAHESKQIQRRCQGCGARRALFRYRGVVKADRDHTLCFECFRAERNRRRSQLLASIPSPRPVVSGFPVRHSAMRDGGSRTHAVASSMSFRPTYSERHLS